MSNRIVVAALAAALAGGCVMKGTHQKVVAERDQARHERDQALSERDDARKDHATCTGKLDACTKSEGEQRAGREGAETKLTASEAELTELRAQRAETEKRLAAFKELTAAFQKMIDTGELRVRVRKGRMLVELPSGVLFAAGKADLSPKGKKALAQVAKVLAAIKDRQFLVAGHTDNQPTKESGFEDNWVLSTTRALVVTKFLIASGMKPQTLAAAGYGEFDPVGTNKNEGGRRVNRRIEIILLPRIDELPRMPES
jgi:chemotaxis protein MotB